MRLPFIIATVLCSLIAPPAALSAPPAPKKIESKRHAGLNIRVVGKDWGKVSPQQVQTVLYAVADELLTRLPKKLANTVVVMRTDSHPVALYERGPKGEYLVQLHAGDDRWHLYVYEFAHEFCHILSNYEENAGADVGRYNQWFEETLCETASLFALESLAAKWQSAPPTPELAGQAVKLRRFYEQLIAEGHRQLPPHTELAAWVQENEAALRSDPYQREKNDVLAKLLLPLFATDPDRWDAIAYLNLHPADPSSSLADYLHHWYDNAPDEHKLFIADVFSLLNGSRIVPLEPRRLALNANPAR